MNIQLLFVLLLIAGAVLFLASRLYKTFSGKKKSGDCPNCGTNDNVKVKEHKA